MRRRFAQAFLATLLASLVALTAALAQEPGDESRFAKMIEALVSSPGRSVSINGLKGVFSANPTVESITVSDGKGPWLELKGVALVWKRAALLDRMLDIESLRAREVTFLRKPEAAPEAAESSGGGFSGLPIAVRVDAISLPRIVLSAPVAGAEAELAAAGSARLTKDVLAAQISVYRQDRAGTLTAELRLEPDANVLTADLALDEPPNGLVAELIGLPNRPAIAARLSGTGPLEDWSAKLTASAAGTEVLSGSMAVSRVDAGYRVVADMAAQLETLAPADYATLLAGDSHLTLDLSRFDSGAITLATANLHSAGMTLSASGRTTPDLVPESAVLSLRLGQAGRATLPFAPGEVSVAGLQVDAELEHGTSAPWRVGVAADDIEGAFGRLAKLTLNASGEAANLSKPSARSTSFSLSGALQGLAPSDPDLGTAVGGAVQLTAKGTWTTGDPLTVSDLSLVLDNAAASFAGTATADELAGDFGVTASDLSRFAGLAGRALGGSAQLEAKGTLARDGGFDLQLDGATADLKLGIAALDPLLAGTTTLAGGVARKDDGLAFDNLALRNDRMTAEVNGSAGGPELNLSVDADVADISSVTERAAGAAHISATLSGASDAPRVEAEIMGDDVALMGRPLTNASARFSGVVAGPDTAGEAEISGMLGDTPVKGSASLSAGEGGARVLKGVTFAVGESRASGDLTIGSDGLFSGDISVASPDLSKIAPLFLVDASGTLSAEISLAAEDGTQSASISGTADNIAYESVSLESAAVKGRGRDLFNAPALEGNFTLRNLRSGGLTIVSAEGTAERSDGATALNAEAQLADGRAKLEASLAPQAGGGLAIGLKSFAFQRGTIDVALSKPATIVVADGAAGFDGTTFRAGSGTATLSGKAGEALDLNVALKAIPAALANSFSPTLGADGTISGTVAVSGTASAPVVNFDLALANASVAAARDAGVGPLAIAAKGSFAEEKVELKGRVTGAGGLALEVSGGAGTAEGAPLDVSVAGKVPLSLGNPQLAARGAALSGVASVDMKVAGTRASPQFSGRITADGGGFVDPQGGIVLKDLSLAAAFTGRQLTIERLTAKSGEGSLSAEGSLGLDPNAGMPVDLAIKMKRARYADGTLIAATFDADLKVTGRLTDAPKVTGTVSVDRAEITVPERLPGDSVAVAVEHVAPPAPVERTLAILREGEGSKKSGGGFGGLTLDIKVSAPRQIFVRGRGLDSELGGQMRLVGPVSSVVTSGSFEIVRGRLDILTHRIALDRGIITFAGDLDPVLDFVGTTQSGNVTITVTISGRASDPQITFSSSPDLPQDEILAQLIFQKGISDLSALQIARLGAAAAELSGGSGGGVLSRLRETTGLDDLDIVVDEEGQAALAAGRYISDNVYVGVQQGTTAESSRVTVDLDITKGVKARAGYSVEGESSLGIFFEHEY